MTTIQEVKQLIEDLDVSVNFDFYETDEDRFPDIKLLTQELVERIKDI